MLILENLNDPPLIQFCTVTLRMSVTTALRFDRELGLVLRELGLRRVDVGLGLLEVELGGVVVLGELLGGGLELVDAGGECVGLVLLVLDGVGCGQAVRERAGAQDDGGDADGGAVQAHRAAP